MYIDLDAYSASKKAIVSWLSSRARKDLTDNMTMISAVTFCPCIVVGFYAGEAFGWDEDIIKYIRRLIDFYGYDSILNKPEGCPI
jgi:hypothetical protein